MTRQHDLNRTLLQPGSHGKRFYLSFLDEALALKYQDGVYILKWIRSSSQSGESSPRMCTWKHDLTGRTHEILTDCNKVDAHPWNGQIEPPKAVPSINEAINMALITMTTAKSPILKYLLAHGGKAPAAEVVEAMVLALGGTLEGEEKKRAKQALTNSAFELRQRMVLVSNGKIWALTGLGFRVASGEILLPARDYKAPLVRVREARKSTPTQAVPLVAEPVKAGTKVRVAEGQDLQVVKLEAKLAKGLKSLVEYQHRQRILEAKVAAHTSELAEAHAERAVLREMYVRDSGISPEELAKKIRRAVLQREMDALDGG